MIAYVGLTQCRPSASKSWTTRRIKEMEIAFCRAYTFAMVSHPGYMNPNTPHVFVNEDGSFSTMLVLSLHGMTSDEANDFLTDITGQMARWGYLTSHQVFDDFLTQPLDNAEQTGTIRA